jgi:hypothetical protein
MTFSTGSKANFFDESLNDRAVTFGHETTHIELWTEDNNSHGNLNHAKELEGYFGFIRPNWGGFRSTPNWNWSL